MGQTAQTSSSTGGRGRFFITASHPSLLHRQHTAQAAAFMQQVERLVDFGQVHVVGDVFIHLDLLWMIGAGQVLFVVGKLLLTCGFHLFEMV